MSRIKVGKPKISNCWWETFKLLFSRRIVGIIIKKPQRIELPHIMGFTSNGNVVQFKRVGNKQPQRFSIFLPGILTVISKKLWGKTNQKDYIIIKLLKHVK